jgi:hypothetical protein
MGDVLPFRTAKLPVALPETAQAEPLCKDCKPNGDGGYLCIGGKCAGRYHAPDRDPA